jgi:hypothetical protein
MEPVIAQLMITLFVLAMGWSPDLFCLRHARPCAGHPRLGRGEDVDGRDKLGHDAATLRVS